VLAFALVLGGQALADVAAPETPNGALTGQSMGRAGFAYLTGLRRFAAAVLWNRLEPQMHEYYGGLAGSFELPSIQAIVALDPEFVPAYYVGPWLVTRSRRAPGVSVEESSTRLATGLELAREGVVHNPKSGILLASYAELLFAEANDMVAALPYAKAALAPDVAWRNDEEQWDSYAILRAIFDKAGDLSDKARVQAVMDAIDANPNATGNAPDSD
jgi:hypothetical protein